MNTAPGPSYIETVQRLTCEGCLSTVQVKYHSPVAAVAAGARRFNDVQCPTCGLVRPRVELFGTLVDVESEEDVLRRVCNPA